MFPVNFKKIYQYQQKDPGLMVKLKTGKYKSGYFHVVSNKTFNIIMCISKNIIPLIIQSFLLNWYHIYILRPGRDMREAIICQNFYWPGLRRDV